MVFVVSLRRHGDHKTHRRIVSRLDIPELHEEQEPNAVSQSVSCPTHGCGKSVGLQ